MATLSSAAAIAACNAIVDLVDAGNEAGRMIVTTASAASTLATITLLDPAFDAAADAGSEATADLDVTTPRSDPSADNTGTAAEFYLQSMNSGTPTTVISGSVGLSGASPDIVIDNTSIVAGQTVNLTALSVSVAEAST